MASSVKRLCISAARAPVCRASRPRRPLIALPWQQRQQQHLRPFSATSNRARPDDENVNEKDAKTDQDNKASGTDAKASKEGSKSDQDQVIDQQQAANPDQQGEIIIQQEEGSDPILSRDEVKFLNSLGQEVQARLEKAQAAGANAAGQDDDPVFQQRVIEGTRIAGRAIQRAKIEGFNIEETEEEIAERVRKENSNLEGDELQMEIDDELQLKQKAIDFRADKEWKELTKDLSEDQRKQQEESLEKDAQLWAKRLEMDPEDIVNDLIKHYAGKEYYKLNMRQRREKRQAILKDLTEGEAADAFKAIQETVRGIKEESGEFASQLGESIAREEAEDDIPEERERVKIGFWGEGEEELGEDEEFHGDDITSDGHLELERIRDLRKYARAAAWELPLLASTSPSTSQLTTSVVLTLCSLDLTKPFVPPDAAKVPLQFRYTTYLGENHPAQNKVVVQFSLSSIPSLTTQQRNKLIKLAGPRYNPSTGTIKMSCEQFPAQAQNKRYLSDTIDALITEARDGKDTFEDVPFDFRYHKPKPQYVFPKEWILTDERRKQLEMNKAKLLEGAKQRKVTDGNAIVERVLARRMAEPVLAAPTTGRAGRQPARR